MKPWPGQKCLNMLTTLDFFLFQRLIVVGRWGFKRKTPWWVTWIIWIPFKLTLCDINETSIRSISNDRYLISNTLGPKRTLQIFLQRDGTNIFIIFKNWTHLTFACYQQSHGKLKVIRAFAFLHLGTWLFKTEKFDFGNVCLACVCIIMRSVLLMRFRV